MNTSNHNEDYSSSTSFAATTSVQETTVSTVTSSTVPVLGSLGTDSNVKADEAHIERFCGQIFVLLIVWFSFNVITKVMDIAPKIKHRLSKSVQYRLQSSTGTSLTETAESRGAYRVQMTTPENSDHAIQGINLCSCSY